MTPMDYTAPTCDDFEIIARQTVERLPHAFRGKARIVAIRVIDFPTDDMMEELGADAYELTGLYEGIPLPEKSITDQPMAPDVVWLFRRPVLDEWAERGDVSLGDLIAHITIHEFAHHFGWSDDDIAAIDQWWT